MAVGLIWAQDRNGVIGADNALPWSLPEDQRRFRALTTGHTVVMGRLTWDSLPERFRPLPGRDNVVLTRDLSFQASGAEVVHDLATALQRAVADAQTWVIGGAQVYALSEPFASVAEVTEVDVEAQGDAHAPTLSAAWQLTTQGAWQRSETGLRYRFLTYERSA